MNILVNKALVAAVAALFLAGCGGGGGGGNPVASNDPAPPAPTPDPAPAPAPDPTPGPQDAALQAGEELATAEANGNLPLPSEHGIPSGRIEIVARAYTDRNGFRFSCTGSDACIVAIDATGGRAQVVAGRVRLARLPAEPTPKLNPPVAMPTPDPEPTPPVAMPEPEPVVLSLPIDHEFDSASDHQGRSGLINAGETRSRNHVRFTCAAGVLDCRYTYLGDGRIRVESGTLTVDAVPWPPYLIMDVARLSSILGGSALEWGNARALSELQTRLPNTDGEVRPSQSGCEPPPCRFGLSDSGERIEARFADMEEGSVYASLDQDGNVAPDSAAWYFSTGSVYPTVPFLDTEHLPQAEAVITDEHGIEYVQAVSKDYDYPDPHDGSRSGWVAGGVVNPWSAYLLGGVLDYADFWIEEEVGFAFPRHTAFFRLYDPNRAGAGSRLENPIDPITATWQGSLIGIGHNKADPKLYRQLIAGDVAITTSFTTQEEPDLFIPVGAVNRVNVDVAFSDIRKVKTGEAVMLSTMNWNLGVEGTYQGRNSAQLAWPDFSTTQTDGVAEPENGRERERMELEFGGPGYSTAAGIFITLEAVGAFGAKKQ